MAFTSEEDIDKIIRFDHHDPFAVLGAHEVSSGDRGGVVIRVHNPDAVQIRVLDDSNRNLSWTMKHVNHGFFELLVPDRERVFPYVLQTHYQNGSVQTQKDPYSFLPIISEYDLHLFSEGRHHHAYTWLGAHPRIVEEVEGVLFAVWAPSAKRVSVTGAFNNWDGRRHPMRVRGSSGVWELFIPGLKIGDLYKYEIKPRSGEAFVKADPYAFFREKRPGTASIVYDLDGYEWSDGEWLARRDDWNPYDSAISIYEVHLGSWLRKESPDDPFYNYRELADKLVPYVKEHGFTHIELLPVLAHPLDVSWGYQVTGYFAPTARFGRPADFMYFVDTCHQHGIGVILDWVPAHFPKDAHGLARFDGSHLYEHVDPRQGEHPDWQTLVFNYGRSEVRNYLISNALFWFERYHLDGLRVDAVASMLYLDYSREPGEWIPNKYGGNENLDAVSFLKELNQVVFKYHRSSLMIAEESTAWPGVTRPTHLGGLGFNFKWNMGWMHDTLQYMSKEPVHRKYHHNLLSFGMLYAYHENFILPLSHDEVVHGKGALISKMPGDRWQKFANLRLLYGYMFGFPGKLMLFMGGEFGQWNEWNCDCSLDWDLLRDEDHLGLQRLVRDLNRLYVSEPALHEMDFDPSGFEWIDVNDSDQSTLSFIRFSRDRSNFLVFVLNFTPVVRYGFKLGVPESGQYAELLNTDAELYGGSNAGNWGSVTARSEPWHGRACSIEITLPPLAAVVFRPAPVR